MKKFLQLSILLAFAASYGQTTLFFDNFNPATYPTPDATANVALTGSPSNVSTALYTYTGFNSAPAGWYLASGNGTSGINCIWNSTAMTYTTNLSIQGSSISTPVSYRGTGTISVPMSSFHSSFKPILKTNSDVITWSFSMRSNRSSQLTTLPSALRSGFGMCTGVILATNGAADVAIETVGSLANGYAVLLSGDDASTANSVSFGTFDGGLSYDSVNLTSTFTSLLKVGNVPVATSMSVIVTYTPSSDTWTLKVRPDGGSSLVDPEATTANSYLDSTPVSVINGDYTSATNTNMMMYYNYNGSNGAYLDNLKVKSDAALGITENEIEGLKVYPNPVSNGTLYVTSTNNSEKQVAIYTILGQQVLQTKTTSGEINVSSLGKGGYLLKITEDGKSETKKLIIE
ncbi:T9SS type A sorting domain-containing protein [Flavobacterium cellulosilyticum]|uniref:T9SS type A sorting domain-containing protein n=1 Tax=Flavobacterium cellulosilyticum TaxID=2541731 RepID=A0A4R5CHK6_9FLAO|nr:T9SS type A sorting domain-containing protein [Flavobacterium cellulosilyticum]TDD98536.1 T9SS type A sorting domain-containing protein [Flavobacterium cellulosilyticum]